MKKILILIIAVFSGSGPLLAQQAGFDIFNFAPLPSALALSEATTAVPDGAGSVHTNPALLALMPGSTIDLGYSKMIGDAGNIFGGINLRNGNRALAFTVYRSGDDGFEQRNTQGPSNGTFSVNYLSLGAAAAYKFSIFSAGFSAQFNREEIYLDKSNGYSVNAGLAAEFFSQRLRTGISFVSLGKMSRLVASEPVLPAAFRAGLAFDVFRFVPPKNADLPIIASLAADFVVPAAGTPDASGIGYYNDKTYANFGLSLNIADVVALKAGYKTGDTARPVSFGAGVITELLEFNYSLIPFETGFGTVHSIGVQYKF